MLRAIIGWKVYLIICISSLTILLGSMYVFENHYKNDNIVVAGFAVSIFLIVAPVVLKLIVPEEEFKYKVE